MSSTIGAIEHHDGTVTEIPLAWSTIEPVDDAYRRWLALVRVFSDTGLYTQTVARVQGLSQ